MNTNVNPVLPAERAAPSSAVCPLCHTAETSISNAALTAGASWRCERCGQRWDAHRLETAAAYAATV
jgi:transposase